MIFKEKFNETFKAAPFRYGFGIAATITGILDLCGLDVIISLATSDGVQLNMADIQSRQVIFMVLTLCGIALVISGVFTSILNRECSK